MCNKLIYMRSFLTHNIKKKHKDLTYIYDIFSVIKSSTVIAQLKENSNICVVMVVVLVISSTCFSKIIYFK